MQKEFEYTCKTQKEFIQMVSEHKAGFKLSQDAAYEIHILYKNGNEFHLNANKTDGTFSRTGIKAGVISTALEEIHFGNISELELSVQKFNMITFWKSKSKNDSKAEVVFEFISEMIDKTKTDKYHSNDTIVRMLRGFKFNTNSNFNLCMTLDLHYITEFSAEILFLFSEYMKNQCGYVVASSKQEVSSMTTMTTKTNNINHNKASDAETQAAAEKKAFIKAAKKADLLTLITSLSIVNTEYDDNKELTKLFIKVNIQSDYNNLVKDINFIKLLTDDYSTESNEKKVIQKLLQSFVVTYKNAKKDIDTAITHSNIHVCIKTDEKHYSVLKKFNLSIFDIIKIDTMTELHTVLKSNAFNKACPVSDILNFLIKELQDKIKKTVENQTKSVYIDNREFKRMLMKCTLKAGKIQCTYNKSNVQNFISGYVISSYNGRLKKFVSELKATK